RVDPGPLLPEEADKTRHGGPAEAPLVAEDHAVPALPRPRDVEQERTRRVREGSPAEPRERGGHFLERGEVLPGPVRVGEGAAGGDLLGAQDLVLVHGVTVAASRGAVKVDLTADRPGAPGAGASGRPLSSARRRCQDGGDAHPGLLPGGERAPGPRADRRVGGPARRRARRAPRRAVGGAPPVARRRPGPRRLPVRLALLPARRSARLGHRALLRAGDGGPSVSGPAALFHRRYRSGAGPCSLA